MYLSVHVSDENKTSTTGKTNYQDNEFCGGFRTFRSSGECYRTKYSVIDKMRVVTKKKISENVRRNLINSHLSVVRLM
jgi:hypothetical protein